MPTRSATPVTAIAEFRRSIDVGARRGRAGLLALSLTAVAGPARAASTELVSVARDGGAGNGDSYTFRTEVSDDGRFVAFRSDASDLIPGDTNGLKDVFVRDRRSGRTERVSVGAGRAQAEEGGTQPSMSDSGRYVAFESNSRLAPDDADDLGDVFVHDREAGTTELVSLKKGGSGGPAVSADGRLVAYERQPVDRDEPADILVRNRGAASTALISVGPGGEANEPNFYPAISAGGRYVAFWTRASNLVPGDTNGEIDIFVRDRGAGMTTRVSVGPGGAQANAGSTYFSMSVRSRYVAFQSEAGNLVPGDTNGEVDVFVHDRETGLTSRVSVGAGGVQANAASSNASISADGRYVAFESVAANLVAGDTNGKSDVFVHDRQTGATTRVSLTAGGGQANDQSYGAAISGDGAHVAFVSDATNLVAGDGNGLPDIYVRAR